VAQYQKLATRAIQQIWRRGKVAILVGGTGFYIQAVVDGLILPVVPPNQKLRKELNSKTPAELFKLLKKLDPKRARGIDRHNPRRLIRAIEIAQALGRVPGLQVKPLGAKILMIGLNPDLADLKKKINVRLAKRLKQGMLAEVKKLRGSGLSWRKLEDFGLEYRYLAQYLQGKISRPEMIIKLASEIYNYAKRQFTWFKRDKRIIWTNNKQKIFALVRTLLEN